MKLISNEKYLKAQLESKKAMLQHLHVQHQVDVAKYNAKVDMLNSDIHSIERQLDVGEEDK